jgi:hypothetical protein
MKKTFCLTMVLAAFSSSSSAEKLYMGIFKTATEYGAWVTLRDAPCNTLGKVCKSQPHDGLI